MANIFICNLQKIVLYETKARFYVIGSNNTEDIFRVLKIDRTEPRELQVSDDKIEYSRTEVQDLLRTLEVGNRPKQQGQKGTAGLARTVSAFGILGFVSFLEGYYIILVTKRRRVAVIGGHTIYKIEDSSMVYIPNDACVASKVPHPDEARYVRNFQNVDLSSNFYFSYSYDLTNTLQHNLTPIISSQGPSVYRSQPMMKYVWNAFLWRQACRDVHPDWVLYIIHGFIGQVNVCTLGRSIYIALIARRSNHFAGTRFLKRGANSEGYVANEVETEQIVQDASLTQFKRGRYTSFVQVRGSVPGMWSQDISNMVPKPPINLDMADPYARLAGGHFNQLLGRYGSPAIVIDLVKKRERRKREAILSEELVSAIKYLNQFLPPRHTIQYIALDMARYTKNPNLNVISRLDTIADKVVKQTGIFLSGPHMEPSLQVRPQARCVYPNADKSFTFIKQMGVARTNCVDCLDRTNTAQFVIGKYALGHQLFCLGVVDSPTLQFDTDAMRMLEDLFEDMGDTLALQYGGSQLVHSIRTYRKLSPWTSHSRDIKQTLSRYYSNTFADTDKQSALNLFLGVFKPSWRGPSLWDLPTDYYLHHTEAAGLIKNKQSCTQWFDTKNIQTLPLPCEEVEKSLRGQEQSHILQSTPHIECIDPYFDYYRPAELTSLQELFCSNMPHSIRDFMPKMALNCSPFTVRVSQSKTKEELLSFDQKSAARVFPERLVTGGSPKTSSDLPSSSEGTSSSDEEPSEPRSVSTIGGKSRKQELKMKDLFPNTKEVYGVAIKYPVRQDISVYQRFVSVDLNSRSSCPDVHSISGRTKRCIKRATRLIPNSVFSLDSSYEVTPPTLNRSSRAIFEAYMQKGKVGAQSLYAKDQEVYRKFVQFKTM